MVLYCCYLYLDTRLSVVMHPAPPYVSIFSLAQRARHGRFAALGFRCVRLARVFPRALLQGLVVGESPARAQCVPWRGVICGLITSNLLPGPSVYLGAMRSSDSLVPSHGCQCLRRQCPRKRPRMVRAEVVLRSQFWVTSRGVPPLRKASSSGSI